MFLVDGPVLLAEALAAGATVDAAYVDDSGRQHPSVRAARAAGVPLHDVASDALAKVLDLKSPRGVVSVVRQRRVPLADLLAQVVERGRPLVVLVGLQDPGNVGTLVRVAEATGCAGVALTPGSVDVHNPKTVRATAGAVFRVPVVEQVDLPALLDDCRARGVATYATVGRGGVPVESADLRGAFAVLIGAEAHGLDEATLARCSSTLTVPMEGGVESLNAAIAGSVVLFDAARQRRTAPSPKPMRHNDEVRREESPTR